MEESDLPLSKLMDEINDKLNREVSNSAIKEELEDDGEENVGGNS